MMGSKEVNIVKKLREAKAEECTETDKKVISFSLSMQEITEKPHKIGHLIHCKYLIPT